MTRSETGAGGIAARPGDGAPQPVRRRRLLRRLAGVSLAIPLLASGLTVSDALFPGVQAHAAWEGAGITIAGVHVGTLISTTNGSNAYCIEPDGDNPAAEVPAVEMDVLRGYRMQSTGHWVAPYSNEHGIRMMNYIISSYGGVQTGPAWANEQAAAVSLAIWTIRGWDDPVVADWVAGIRAQAPASVNAQTDVFLVEADTNAVPTPSITAPPQPVARWTDAYTGAVEMSAGYTELRLVGSQGRFTGSAPEGVEFDPERTRATITDGRAHTLSFESRPGLETGNRSPLSLTAAWRVTGKGWPASLWGFQPVADDADQLLIVGAGLEEVEESGEWRDTPMSPQTTFSPVVTTEVGTKKLERGDDYVDRVTFDVAQGSAPWARYWDGSRWRHRPVTAKGTLYGPMQAKPVQSRSVPQSPPAPIAATAELTATGGPGTYDARVRVLCVH